MFASGFGNRSEFEIKKNTGKQTRDGIVGHEQLGKDTRLNAGRSRLPETLPTLLASCQNLQAAPPGINQEFFRPLDLNLPQVKR